MSEAQARIKINRLLEKAGWRFFDSKQLPVYEWMVINYTFGNQSYETLSMKKFRLAKHSTL